MRRPCSRGFPAVALCAAVLFLAGAVPGRYSARAVPPGDAPSVGVLQFMTGTWETNPGKQKGAAVTEEVWIVPRGGTMLGVNRVTKAERTVSWEHLRIEERPNDGVYYVANPQGRGERAYRLSKIGAHFAEFEDSNGDWPQTISYGLTDIEGQLTAVVSGEVDGRPRTETWTYLRQSRWAR